MLTFRCRSRFCGRLQGQGDRPKGQSTGRQVPRSPPRPAPGEGGAGQPSRPATWVLAETDHPPHTHAPWAADAGELGWGRQGQLCKQEQKQEAESHSPWWMAMRWAVDGDGHTQCSPALPGAGSCGISARWDAQGDPRPAHPLLQGSPRQGPFWKPCPPTLDFVPGPCWGHRRETALQTPA